MNDKMDSTVNKSQDPEVANATPLQKLPFQLQDGEKIIRELKPQFLGFMLSKGFGGYMELLGIIIIAIAIVIILLSGVLVGILSSILLIKISEGLLIGLATIPILIFAIISIKPFISYGKSWYWITNRRVIGKRGFLGYSIDSIPLENVSDVVLSRTVLDRLLGLSSLIIVPLSSTGSRTNAGITDESAQNPNFFPALPQKMAIELQRVLFNLREDLRKSHDSASASSRVPQASAPTSSETAQPKNNVPREDT